MGLVPLDFEWSMIPGVADSILRDIELMSAAKRSIEFHCQKNAALADFVMAQQRRHGKCTCVAKSRVLLIKPSLEQLT